MQRIMIIGCCGAGKSTLARKLHQQTGLPLIHLDQHHWQPEWVELEDEPWKEKVQELADRPQWIIDGNYGGTLDIRLRRADTLIYLDYPTLLCLWRVIKRVSLYNGQVRPDMPTGCPERWNWEFLHYVATFNLRKRRRQMALLDTYRASKKVIIFKGDSEAEAFLNTLSA